jgi:hypothetical protein
MLTRLERIKKKLADLKDRDTRFQIFGASKHEYKLQPTRTEAELASFESSFGIQLPNDYRDFIKYIGDGGAVPYYGIETLAHTLYNDLDRKDFDDLLDPSIDFPHTEAWNLEFMSSDGVDLDKREEIYFDKKWITGVLRVCDFGCGVSINIVVSGQEYGNIWVDDRCNDGGIYPDHYFGNKDKIDFLTWYELWLDRSLTELEK